MASFFLFTVSATSLAGGKAAKGKEKGKTRTRSLTKRAAKKEGNNAAGTVAPPRRVASPTKEVAGKYVGQQTSGRFKNTCKIATL